MLSLVLHALRARRAQSLAMFALAVLAGLGSAAAPWFLGWGRDSVVLANLASSPVEERLVRARVLIRHGERGGPGSGVTLAPLVFSPVGQGVQ